MGEAVICVAVISGCGAAIPSTSKPTAAPSASASTPTPPQSVEPSVTTYPTLPGTNSNSAGTAAPTTTPSVPTVDGVPEPCGPDTGQHGTPFPGPAVAATRLTPTATDLQSFQTVFAQFNLITQQEITLVPGSAHAALIPSTGEQWGLATYREANGVHNAAVTSALTPPGDRLVFVKPAGCPWSENGTIASVFPCTNLQDVPVSVVTLWGLKEQSASACSHAVVPPTPR